MSPLEEQMAKAIAAAVKYESDRQKLFHRFGYIQPEWYADAVTALAAYSVEKEREEQEKLRVNY